MDSTQQRLQRLTRVLRAICNVNQLIYREHDRGALLQKVCNTLIESNGYQCAWIVTFDKHRRVHDSAHARVGKNFPDFLERIQNDEWPLSAQMAFERPEEVVVIDDPARICCPANAAEDRIEVANFCYYFRGEVLHGIFTACVPKDRAADTQEKVLFKEVAQDIAFAFRREEERRIHEETETDLVQREKQRRLIIDHIPSLIAHVDRELRFTFANRYYEDFFGISSEFIVGKTLHEIIGESLFQEIESTLQAALRGDHVEFEQLRESKKYGERWFNVVYVPDVAPDDSIQGIYGFMHDIDSVKKAEEALRERNRELLTIQKITDLSLINEPLGRLAQLAAEEIAQITKFPYLAIEQYIPERGIMRFLGTWGLSLPANGDMLEVAIDETLSGIVMETGKPLVLQDALDHPQYSNKLLRDYKTRTFIGIPLVVGDRFIGCLSLGSPREKTVDEALMQLLSNIASHMASLIEYKRAEEAIRVQALMIDQVHDCIISTDPDGIVISWNHGAENLLGYSRQEALGRHIEFIYPEEELDRRRDFIPALYKHNKYETDVKYRRKNGGIIDARLAISLMNDENGRHKGLIGCSIDITGRKKAEIALKERQEELSLRSRVARLFLMSPPETVYQEVLELLLKTFQSASGLFCCFDVEQLVCLAASEDLEPHFDLASDPRSLEEKYDLIEPILTEHIHIFCNEPLNWKSGKRRFDRALGTPVLYRDEFIGLIFIADKPQAYTHRDRELLEAIAGYMAPILHARLQHSREERDRLRAEQEREQIEAQLLQSQKLEAIGQLAGGVAHDFNNLMQVVGGYSDIILTRMEEDAPHRAEIIEIRNAADRAAGLTRQLLAFSRQQVLEMKILDLNTAITNLGKMLSRLIGEDVEFIPILEPNLGRIRADVVQMEQILMNLAVNSREAMREGGRLLVETRNIDVDERFARQHGEIEPGQYVMLIVRDTGHGISKKDLSHVFEPFFTTKEKSKGTGLGLATVYGIVKQHGGHIWVESEEGVGATFKICFPRVKAAAGEPEETRSLTPHEGGNETVFVVEDDRVVRDVVCKVLEMSGYHVLEAGDPHAAIEFFTNHKEPVDLMITDVIMPHMNGKTMHDRIRQLHPETKALFISGYTDSGVVQEGLLEPGTHFMQKPFSISDLGRKVREMLDA